MNSWHKATATLVALLAATQLSAQMPNDTMAEPEVQDITPSDALAPSPVAPGAATGVATSPYPAPATVPPPADAERLRRGAPFNHPHDQPLAELPGPSNLQVTDHPSLALVPALPAARSAVVLVGRVMSGATFLSPDGTTLYTEYEIKVESVLAPSTARPISPSETLTVQRQGGRIVWPSGKVEWRSIADGRKTPKRLGRYVLFLEWNSAADTFPLVTGYRLQGGKVVEPLDPGS